MRLRKHEGHAQVMQPGWTTFMVGSEPVTYEVAKREHRYYLTAIGHIRSTGLRGIVANKLEFWQSVVELFEGDLLCDMHDLRR